MQVHFTTTEAIYATNALRDRATAATEEWLTISAQIADGLLRLSAMTAWHVVAAVVTDAPGPNADRAQRYCEAMIAALRADDRDRARALLAGAGTWDASDRCEVCHTARAEYAVETTDASPSYVTCARCATDTFAGLRKLPATH